MYCHQPARIYIIVLIALYPIRNYHISSVLFQVRLFETANQSHGCLHAVAGWIGSSSRTYANTHLCCLLSVNTRFRLYMSFRAVFYQILKYTFTHMFLRSGHYLQIPIRTISNNILAFSTTSLFIFSLSQLLYSCRCTKIPYPPLAQPKLFSKCKQQCDERTIVL